MRNHLLLAAAFASCVGCVTQGKYDQAVQSADVASSQLRRTTARDAADETSLRSQVTEELAVNAQLRGSLATANTSTAVLMLEKQALASSLDQTKRAQAIAEAHAKLFHDLAMKLKTMVEAGQLSVVIRDGRMVLQLPSDVLFLSGQADVRAGARPALKLVATVLKTVPDRDFQIAGHTDNVPIENSRYPSNWELSSARALEVMRILVADGVNPSALSTAAYSEFDPVVSNSDEKGRAKNRRIEITVEPNIDELVWVPSLH